MAKVIDLVGQRFFRLTVLEEAGRLSANATWRCRCDCGNEITVRSNCLRRGITKSCGCYQKEVVSKQQTTHGMTNTKEFAAWSNMLDRCYNPNSRNYHNYGARGITVCDRWRGFTEFYTDMGSCPAGMTLERLNNDLGYSPENCVWANMRVQSANTRRVINSSTGKVGVWERGNGKYRAAIRVEGKLIHIGEFTTVDAAVAARKEYEAFYLSLRSLSDNSIDLQQSAV